jgi:hypothetical protein
MAHDFPDMKTMILSFSISRRSKSFDRLGMMLFYFYHPFIGADSCASVYKLSNMNSVNSHFEVSNSNLSKSNDAGPMVSVCAATDDGHGRVWSIGRSESSESGETVSVPCQ